MKRMRKSGAGALLTLCLLVSLTAQAPAAQTAGTEVTAPRRSGCDAATIHYTDAAGTEREIPFRETADGYVYTRPQGVSAQQVTVEYFSTVQWDGAVDISWYDPEKTEFTLTAPAQLAGLAALVNGRTSAETSRWRIKGDTSLLVSTPVDDVVLVGAGGGNVRGTIYYASARYDFADKTVYLGCDMDMGGTANWTPIGGKYAMDTAAQDDPVPIEAFFNGTLDGRGHRITNLYCDRYSDKHFAYSQAIGLVGYLGQLYEGEQAPSQVPTVRNLSVSGSVHGRRMVGGIVGRVGDIATGVHIENCANYAAVSSTDAKGVGGIVGAGWGTGHIVNCYNTGAVSSTYQCPGGGICGNNGGMDIYACYNVGTVSSSGRGRGIGGHDAGTYTVANCYTLSGCDDDPGSGGWYVGTGSACTIDVGVWTVSRMRSAELVEKLNANGGAYVYDAAGYPRLFWENGWPDSTCRVTVQNGQGVTVTAEPAGSVAGGTVVYLRHETAAGSVFRGYTANGQRLLGDYYTVLDAVTLSAEAEGMVPGTVQIPDSGVYTITVTKTGTVFRDDGTAQQVTDYPVSSGDLLYEGDVLTAAAVLRQGQYPADNDETYTGKFTYSFLYSDGSGEGSTTATGRFTASGNTAPLVVTASPLTSRKLWTQTADTSWYSAEKSAFTLTTARQLAGLALLVNNGTDDFSGKTVRLGADIVLRNDDGTNGTRLWDGIGKYHRFAGTFDGGGHTVSQMTAGAGGTASSGNAALFLNCEGALIRDLTVSGTAEGGRAAGLVLDMTGTTLRSCTVQVLVTATGSGASGGIAGTVSGDSLLDHCVNVYAVSGGDGVGGLAGKLEGSTVQDSVNYGMVTGSGTNGGLGGLVGSTASGTLLRCANYGTVSGRSWYTGGITGILGSTAQAVLRDCCNAASVTGGHAVYSKAVVGGLAGRGNVYTMQNCFNSGAVSAADTLKGAAGGVLGTDGGSSKSSRTAVWYLDSACAAAVGSGTAGQSGISACTAQELAGTAVLNAINGDRCFSQQGKGFPELTTVPTGYAVCGRVTGAAGTVDVRLTQGGRLAAQVQTADAFAFYVLTDDGYSLTLSAEGCVSRRMAVPAGTAGDLGTLALCRPGDVNMDGAVDVYDLQRLYEHLCGIDRLTDGYALLLSDMDGSGAVDEQDLRQLHTYCLGGSSAAD